MSGKKEYASLGENIDVPPTKFLVRTPHLDGDDSGSRTAHSAVSSQHMPSKYDNDEEIVAAEKIQEMSPEELRTFRDKFLSDQGIKADFDKPLGNGCFGTVYKAENTKSKDAKRKCKNRFFFDNFILILKNSKDLALKFPSHSNTTDTFREYAVNK